MGIDCDIVIRVKTGTGPQDKRYGPFYCEDFENNGSYFSLDIGQRWFDKSYPRGHFPSIANELLLALADDNCEAVYLANDFGIGDEITPKLFMELCKTWYYNEGRFSKRNNPERNKSWHSLTNGVADT